MTTATKPKKKSEKIKSGKLAAMIQKNWPKAKGEMEKGIREAKKLIVQGEKNLGDLTDKSLKRLRIMVLNHRKQKHYLGLGKLVASLQRTDLETNERVTQQISELKEIDKEIQSLQKNPSQRPTQAN